MSGKIEFAVRLGKSLDPSYDYYTEGYLKIKGEDGNQTTLSPSYNDLMNVIKAFRKHELKVDLTRQRKAYTSKLIKIVGDTFERIKQMTLNEFDQKQIEDIYYKPKKRRFEWNK